MSATNTPPPMRNPSGGRRLVGPLLVVVGAVCALGAARVTPATATLPVATHAPLQVSTSETAPLDLRASGPILNLAPHLWVYVDPTSSLGLARVRTAPFRPIPKLVLANPRATYWLRLTYVGATPERPWVLTAGYRPYRTDLFLGDGRVEHSGDAVPYDARARAVYNWIVFDLPNAATPKTAYLRVRTIEPLVNVVAYTRARFTRDVTRDTVVVAALLAILGSLILSSIVLFFVMRDPLYLYYAGYIVAQAIYRANDFGLLQAYVFPHAPFPYVRTEVFFDGVTLVAATLFIRRFLRSQAYSRALDWVNVAVAVVGGTYALLAVFNVPIRYTLVQNFSFVYVPIWMITGIVCWRRGYAPAKLFLAAWTAYMIGILLEAFVDTGGAAAFGIMRESTPDVVLDYIVYLGIALESILLALSLAQAYRTASAEKIAGLRELIAMRERTEAMAHLAYSDGLTNLPNRTAFLERVDESLRAALRHDRRCALLYLDCNDFKAINDSYGHQAGDAALIEVAARLRRTVRGDEMIGRLGGDEFGIFLPAVDHDDDVAHVVARVREVMQPEFAIGATRLPLSLSIGTACFPSPATTRDELFAAADAAMYRSKERARPAPSA